MVDKKRVLDKTIGQEVHLRLAEAALSACRVAVSVRNGDVAFSGTIQFQNQRRSVLAAANGVEGVRRVLDYLQVKTVQVKTAR